MGFKVSGGKKRVRGEERDFQNDKASNNSHSCTLSAGFSGGSAVNNLPANTGDTGSILKSGRSPGEGNDNPLQRSCLGNPWTEEPGGESTASQKSQTRLSD